MHHLIPRALVSAAFVLLSAAVGLGAAAPTAAPVLLKSAEFHLKKGRYGAAAVAVGNGVYVIGGSFIGQVPTIERFDIQTHQVDQVCDQLLPRRFHNAVEYQGKIYIFGGEGYGTQAQPFEGEVEIFDPATRTLTRGKPMPSPRAHMAASRIGTMVCLTGGVKMKNESERVQANDLDFYDLRNAQWTKGPAMPTARESNAVTVGAFMIVAGGFRHSGRTAEVEMFVPQENAWKSLPPLSRKISGCSAAVLNNWLFLVGDYSDMDSILAYDLRTRQSHDVKVSGFRGARYTTTVALNNTLYVIGGNQGDETATQDLIQVFTLNNTKP